MDITTGFDTESYLAELTRCFNDRADPITAIGQKAYMRNQFDFLGIKAPERRLIQKPFFEKATRPPKEKLQSLLHLLWQKEYREFQYFGQELMSRYKNQFQKGDIECLVFMISRKSWWDTVDFTATRLVGHYFKKYPAERYAQTELWLDSDSIWLRRTAILFQLHYKDETDEALLEKVVVSQLHSEEFFINKAIGWALRQYSATNPEWVRGLVGKHPFSALSTREALRKMKN